ncbi:Phosphoribosylaminoimidazole-succinocarboxamide synthase, partial [Dissostichus eleginoides]
CYCSPDDKAHVPPLFSILVGGGRALCLAAIVPDTRFDLTDTRAVKRERERGRKGEERATAGHSPPSGGGEKTRWPSVVRVSNLCAGSLKRVDERHDPVKVVPSVHNTPKPEPAAASVYRHDDTDRPTLYSHVFVPYCKCSGYFMNVATYLPVGTE